jgi:2-keto-4-pentenoate hydratase
LELTVTNLTQCPAQIVIDDLTERRLMHKQGTQLMQAPQSLEQAFSWQQAVAAQLASQGKPIIGWKSALPNEGRWGLAPMYQQYTGTSCPLPGNQATATVEPEFAWRLTRDLLPQEQPLSAETIRQAMQCHIAIEIIFDRFNRGENVDYYSRLADGLLNQGVWLGPAISEAPAQIPLLWQTENLRHSAMGVHPAGDAFAPVQWLVAFLHQRNIGLYAGQIIITGSLNGLWRLPVNQPVTIEYADLATVEIKFASALKEA